MMFDLMMRALVRARWMAPPDGDSPAAAAALVAAAAAGLVPAAVGAAGAASEPAASPAAAGTSPPAPNGSGEPATGAAADSTAAPESASVTDQPSLLSLAAGKTPETPPPAPEAKPAEAKAPEPDAKPAEASPDPAQDATPDASAKDEAPAPLTIEDLTLPDGARADSPEAKAFVDVLNNGELSRKESAQQLLDLHRKDIERVEREVRDRQKEFWDNLNRGWQDELRADREIGGNRLQTSLSKTVGLIQMFAASQRDADLLFRHMDANGMGNYPPFIRMMTRAADRLRAFEDGLIVSNPAPLAPQRKPGSRGWYDKSIDRAE